MSYQYNYILIELSNCILLFYITLYIYSNITFLKYIIYNIMTLYIYFLINIYFIFNEK